MKQLLITLSSCIFLITIVRCNITHDLFNIFLIYLSFVLILVTTLYCCLTIKKIKTTIYNNRTDKNDNNTYNHKYGAYNEDYINSPIYKKNKTLNNYNFFGKFNDKLLTTNEYVFFCQLKRITDKYNLLIFPKVRLADIFETFSDEEFNKVSSRHIDFTVCNEFGRPIVFIELDDFSHQKKENYIRDLKKNTIFDNMNIYLNRIKINEINQGLFNIEQQIIKYMSSKE